jgi:glycosyltransferase involved in cell wall biosynthesis
MKIFLVVSAMEDGGAERVAATLVNAWAERGDSVTLVATYSGRGTCTYPLSGKVRLVYLADHPNCKGRTLRAYFARIRTLRALIRDCRPDVVVSFLTNVNISTLLASRGLGVPVIASEHNNPLADGRPALLRLVCRFLYPHADAVTLLTRGVVKRFKEMVPGIRNLVVLPNPLPNELLMQKRQPVDTTKRRRLIALGRFNEVKQFDVLINAFSALSQQFQDWDLWIWGEGSERARLEGLVAELGLGERVFLPGRTLTPWVEMGRAQAFVLPSRFEGLPMVLMEAMALGLPCLSFDCPSGPRELTDDGHAGLLIPLGDARTLAEALRLLLTDESLREELGKRAAVSIRERYSLQKIMLIWDELFARLGALETSRVRAGSGESARLAADTETERSGA